MKAVGAVDGHHSPLAMVREFGLLHKQVIIRDKAPMTASTGAAGAACPTSSHVYTPIYGGVPCPLYTHHYNGCGASHVMENNCDIPWQIWI